MKKRSLKLGELEGFAKDVVKDFPNGVVILRGDLAAGKTTFVKAVSKELGFEGDVTSPTFSLQQVYGEKLFHYDIYNHGLEHFLSLGMLEELEKEGLHFVEWGDEKLVALLVGAGLETMTIDIKKLKNNEREYSVCIR
jgi:tRNA threonylcarbamoyladenosine biosynthesis protein TsaE